MTTPARLDKIAERVREFDDVEPFRKAKMAGGCEKGPEQET